MKYDELTEFLQDAYSWTPVTSKNFLMYSYIQESPRKRLNYYPSTGTLTIQDMGGKIDTHRHIRSLDQLEEILCN